MLSNRQKISILNVVANPFFLAIPFALLIIYFLPNPTSRYKLELINEESTNKPKSVVTFCDLDGDGIDEQILAFHNLVKDEAAIKVLNNTGATYDQWNFYGHFQSQWHYFTCADLDEDGFKEIYLYYYRHDSIFMAAFQPFPKGEIHFEDKLITTMNERDGKIDYRVCDTEIVDLNVDGHLDLAVLINAGFSQQPRSIFVYDRFNDTLMHTPSLGAHISSIVIDDLNGDSLPELYCGSGATANIPDTSQIPFNDYSSWFIGFDHHLDYRFAPVTIKGITSSVIISSFESDEGTKMISACSVNPLEYQFTVTFYQYKGIPLSSQLFEFTMEQWKDVNLINQPIQIKGKSYLVIGKIEQYFLLTDQDFNLLKIQIDIPFLSLQMRADLDGDGKKEWVFSGRTSERIVVFDENLKNPTRIPEIQPFSRRQAFIIGVKRNGTKQSELFIQTDDNLYFYHYSRDALYYLKYPLWLLIFGSVVLVLWLTQKLQLLQAKRKQQIEATINSLQMRTLKSQLDPHFMFNVLNGMANNVAQGNTNVAYSQVISFSHLLRRMMSREDKIDISLSQELDFVRHYLELEKYRFKEDFEFEISVKKDVETNIRLPRMLIQLLVENAIKHGLRNKVGLKRILVLVSVQNRRTIIVVEDNGIGREAAKVQKSNEGNGLHILHDMIKLNRKMGGKDIQVNYTDLYDAGGKAIGTRVEVEM